MQKINRKKESVVFTGYYGMNNFGDDIFGAASAWGASTFWDVEFKILAPRIKGVQAKYSVPDWFNRNIYASSNTFGQLARLGFALREVSRNDQLIFGGGSIFSSASSGVMRVVENIAKKTRLGVSAIGVSVGPFDKNADALKVKSFLERFDYLSVRDNASYAIVKDFNLDLPVTMSGDLAGVFQAKIGNSDERSLRNKPIIGIALCNFESIVGYDSEIEKKRNQALMSGMIRAAKNCGAEVHVFSLNNHVDFGDDHLSQIFCDMLHEVGIKHRVIRNSDYSVEDLWYQIANCNAFLSIRLHGAIASYLCDIPFALIEYHQKCTDFLDDIGQYEHHRLAADIDDPERVCQIIEQLLMLNHFPKVRPTDYRNRALQHFLAAPWVNKTD